MGNTNRYLSLRAAKGGDREAPFREQSTTSGRRLLPTGMLRDRASQRESIKLEWNKRSLSVKISQSMKVFSDRFKKICRVILKKYDLRRMIGSQPSFNIIQRSTNWLPQYFDSCEKKYIRGSTWICFSTRQAVATLIRYNLM